VEKKNGETPRLSGGEQLDPSERNLDSGVF